MKIWKGGLNPSDLGFFIPTSQDLLGCQQEMTRLEAARLSLEELMTNAENDAEWMESAPTGFFSSITKMLEIVQILRNLQIHYLYNWPITRLNLGAVQMSLENEFAAQMGFLIAPPLVYDPFDYSVLRGLQSLSRALDAFLIRWAAEYEPVIQDDDFIFD